MYNKLVSVVLPAYNEEEDIEKCLKSVINLDYRKKEIIVVDDCSTDNTVNVVKKYLNRGVKLIQHKKNSGVAAARNTGIKKAKGEILIILNADVVLGKDHIKKILKHYINGADFVVGRSRVINKNDLFPMFIDALDKYQDIVKEGGKGIDRIWSEGWSCRRKILLKNLFNEKIPGASGEDAVLGFKLDKYYKRKYDKKLISRHYAPSSLKAFVKQRVARGVGSAFFNKYMPERSSKMMYASVIFFLSLISLFFYPWNIIWILLFVSYHLVWGYRYSKLIRNKSKIFHLTIASIINFIAYHYGIIKGIWKR